jgi:putative heme-binding domain-containing protein
MRPSLPVSRFAVVGSLGLVLAACYSTAVGETPANFRRDRLVAWCIVPFDAAKRGPAERSEMLVDLGLTRCAYDWRAEHVPTFEEEILQYKKHGIEFFAFWSVHDEAFRLFKKHDLHPQIWQTLGEGQGETQEQKVASAAAAMEPLARRAAELGSKLGLYNHGGWGGEPKNLVAVCEKLHEQGHTNVGIVYNFHHGHDKIDDWPASLAAMKPHLLCLNLNGMNPRAQPKILGIGKGGHEVAMIREILKSGYDGPIGIIDHREQLDARDSLQENLAGLDWVLKEIEKPGSGGPKPSGDPVGKTSATPSRAGDPKNEEQNALIEQADPFRVAPLTVEAQATLNSSSSYNILVASDVKRSPLHWEIFTMPSSGHLTVYLPGCVPDHVRTEAAICDGQPYRIAMLYEEARVRLFVDGEAVADEKVERKSVEPGKIAEKSVGLGIGRLVEGNLGCDGHVEWVRISKGIRKLDEGAVEPVERDESTIGFWKFPVHETHGEGAAPPGPSGAHAHSHSASQQTAAEPVTIPHDPQLVERLLSDAQKRGDVLRGAAVFAAARSACLSCHRVGQQGGAVGPELTGIAKQREPRHIVESLLWPKRDVKPEYTLWQVLTADGETLSGFRVESTDKRLVLRELSTGKTRELSRDEVDAEVAGSTPMPDGLAAALTTQQQLDLIRFLVALGELTESDRADIDAVLAQAQSHGPATFPFDKRPLDPAKWTNSGHPVNRSRLYDFYTKQAEHFRSSAPGAHLLMDFPGLDGADAGHWGVQNEQSWVDDRWNATQLGSMQAGVFRAEKLTAPRGICVRLGEQGELAVCFNPDTRFRASAMASWTACDPQGNC